MESPTDGSSRCSRPKGWRTMGRQDGILLRTGAKTTATKEAEDGSSGMDSLMNTPTSTTEFDAAHAATSACANTRPGLLFVSRKWSPSIGRNGDIFLEAERRIEEVRLRRAPRFCPEGLMADRPGVGAVLRFGFEAACKIAIRRTPAEIVHIAEHGKLAPRCGRTTTFTPHEGGAFRPRNRTPIAFPDRNGVLPFLYGLYMRPGRPPRPQLSCPCQLPGDGNQRFGHSASAQPRSHPSRNFDLQEAPWTSAPAKKGGERSVPIPRGRIATPPPQRVSLVHRERAAGTSPLGRRAPRRCGHYLG